MSLSLGEPCTACIYAAKFLSFASLALLVSMPQNWQVKVYSVLQSPTSLVFRVYLRRIALFLLTMPDRDDLLAISSFCGISTAHCCVNCHRCTTTMTDKVYRIRTTRRALHCLCLYRKKIFSYIKSAVRLECKLFWKKLSVPQKGLSQVMRFFNLRQFFSFVIPR